MDGQPYAYQRLICHLGHTLRLDGLFSEGARGPDVKASMRAERGLRRSGLSSIVVAPTPHRHEGIKKVDTREEAADLAECSTSETALP
jgi:hypothetical protein